MKNIFQLAASTLCITLTLAACGTSGKPTVRPVVNATSAPAATQTSSMPEPMPQGQQITHKELRVTMRQAEISNDYETEFGSKRKPSLDRKFLWAKVELENTGVRTQKLPDIAHFSLIFGKDEFKPGYGHRLNYPDYTTLRPEITPGQKINAWLRFDIPASTELDDFQFVFLPESVHVSFSNPASDYSWADHPEFFWNCGP